MKDNEHTTLISCGDLESLVLALILERECADGQHAKKQVRYVRVQGPANEMRLRCAHLQAELLGVELDVIDPGTFGNSELLLLLDGLESSSPGGILAWPKRCGPDAEGVAYAMAMAEHLREACALKEGGQPVELFMPLIDLEPVQLLDLAYELGAPFQASWPCDEGLTPPCKECHSCSLWVEAASKLGHTWPWHAPAPA